LLGALPYTFVVLESDSCFLTFQTQLDSTTVIFFLQRQSIHTTMNILGYR